MNLELKKYVDEQLAAGFPKSEIYTALLSNNWPKELVDEVFTELENHSDPVPTPTPLPPVGQTDEPVSPVSQPPALRRTLQIAGLCVGVVAIGSLGLAYHLKVFPFQGGLPYAKDSLASGIAQSFSGMKTFTYSLSGTFAMEDREADARPFVMPVTPEMEMFKAQYTRDYQRVSAVSDLLYKINDTTVFPKSLSELVTESTSTPTTLYEEDYTFGGYFYPEPVDIIDPLTGVAYSYQASADDFRLTVTFETIDALNAITKNYSYDTGATTVDTQSMTVVFTKGSAQYIYLPSELPKSYFEQLNEMAAYLPPELFFTASIEAASDLSKPDSEWQLALDLEGDLGDLMYRVGGDVLRKDKDYYFRIRNIPSLFAGFITYEKGTWIRASAAWLEKNNGLGMYSVPTTFVPSQETEAEYKQFRNELGQFGVAVMKIADEEGVLLVKNEPAKEAIDGKNLYRYDLTFDREKLVSFIKRVQAEAKKYEVTRDSELTNDARLLAYLESPEFNLVFDYYIRNTSLTLWVNQDGFIELAEYSIRVVPGDEVVGLADKQGRLTLRVGFDSINKPIKIEVPAEYKNIEDIPGMGEGGFGPGTDISQTDTSQVKQSLNQVRTEAELSYNSTDFTYNSVCTDENILSIFDSIESTLAGTSTISVIDTPVTCRSGESWYVISAPLPKDNDTIFKYWCIDSSGSAKGDYESLSRNAMSCGA